MNSNNDNSNSSRGIRILHYKAEYLYEHRNKDIIEYLLKHLNNDVEGSVDEFNLLVGSAMVDDLLDERPGEVWLAWLAGRIVAWSTLAERYADDNYQVSTYVHPDYRRKGVGSRLAKKMAGFVVAQRNAGLRGASGGVSSDNTGIVSAGWDDKGISFYEKHNFPKVSECEWER